jgi:hypothetical protein
MSRRTVLALTGPWAILVHIGLTRVRGWSYLIFLEHGWFLAMVSSFLATVVIGGISLAMFRGRPKDWPWAGVPSILGTSAVSAVLLTASVALESVAQSVNTSLRAVSLMCFEVGFLSFFVVLMKAIIIFQTSQPPAGSGVASWWQKLAGGFHAGQHQVQ